MGTRRVRISLPHMAVGGLSENWLFKELGDLHWQMLESRFGLPITELRDAQGIRLLPVFVRVRVDAAQPLSMFEENDACELTGRLTRLDEQTFIGDIGCYGDDKVLTARLMTVFAKRAADNSLVPAVPEACDDSSAPPPDKEHRAFREEFMTSRLAEPLVDAPEGSETGGEPFTCTYDINPYYDLNGARLLYFAAYPPIHDYCERLYFHHLAGAASRAPGGDWSIDASTVARDVFYLGNCGPDDTIQFRLDSCRFEGDQRVRLTSSLSRESDETPIAKIHTVKELVDRDTFAVLWEHQARGRVAGPRPKANGRTVETVRGREGHSPVANPVGSPVANPVGQRPDLGELEQRLIPVLGQTLEVDIQEIARDTDLRMLGLNSFSLVSFASDATRELGVEVDPSQLFQCFTVGDIAQVVAGEGVTPSELPVDQPATIRSRSSSDAGREAEDDDIAIVGMAGRFPEADSVGELWSLLVEGGEAIGEIPADRWCWHAPNGEPARQDNRTARRGGFMRDIRRFDHSFFHISPREAELMDPQQRLFLEVAWETFEEAGYDASRLKGSRTGVFVGVCHNDYAALLHEHLAAPEPHRGVATSFSMIANRVSFHFGLHGSSVAIDTMCSSSLVAVAQAVRALRDGECEQALVGGTNVICDPGQHLAYSRAGVLSPDGRCSTFSEDANGYVRGEGVCALLLKPLRRARADGDHVYAVVKSVSTNHGGQAQSLTAPNADAQAALLVDAYETAGIDPNTLGYLEAHGTGTVLGDPIEVSGMVRAFQQLNRAWGRSEPVPKHCGLGSIKANIGHLEAAAGLAGMIKVMLAMRHRVLPAVRNFKRLNPMIRLQGSPFHVQAEQREWPHPADADGRRLPRRAGVSSFGMGGANAHVVLEEDSKTEFEVREETTYLDPGPHLILLSAKTLDALSAAARNLLEFLDREQCPPLPDIAYTLQVGRQAMEERLAIVTTSIEDLRRGLRCFLAGESDENTFRSGQAEPADEVGVEETSEASDAGLADLARRWTAGAKFDWESRYDPRERPRRVALPTYPFRRNRHWIGPEPPESVDEFLIRDWRAGDSAAAAQPADGPTGTFLVLANDDSLHAASALFGTDDRRRTIVVRGDDLSAGPDSLSSVLAARGGLAEDEEIAGVIDLVDLWSNDEYRPSAVEGRLALLQQILARHRLPSMVCLHLTGTLQPSRTAAGQLVGAELSGLYRMISSEFRSVESRTIDLDFGPDRTADLERVVGKEISLRDRETEVCYREGQRFCAYLRFWSAEERVRAGAEVNPIDGLIEGTVVITGGTGGIGLRLAHQLRARGVRRLVLLGHRTLPARSEWKAVSSDPTSDPQLRQKLRALLELEAQGAELHVYAHVLTDVAATKRLFAGVREQVGPIAAVFHCAGLIGEGRSLLTKSVEDFRRIFEPKVQGLRALWAALEDHSPRLVVLFSSISAAVPQLAASYSDYSSANAFLDSFARAYDGHDGRVVRSLQWPLWEATGMGRGRSSSAGQLGIPDLAAPDALGLLESALRVGGHHVLLPCRAERSQVRPAELLRSPPPNASPPVVVPPRTPSVVGEAEPAKVVEWLTGVFARTLKTDPGALPAGAAFSELGVDSLLLAELVLDLEEALSEVVDPTLLQEHPTLRELAAALARRHAGAIRNVLEPSAAGEGEGARDEPREREVRVAAPAADHGGQVPVAVIGMACRFPGAADSASFWRNLNRGGSYITEVPPSRWDPDALYSPGGEPGRSVSKWGGFINDAAEFDAEYFGFDDHTALYLDPLARKALEVGAECFRDAGYSDEELKGRDVGVYVGSRTSNYREYLRPLPREAIVGTNQNFIAAHVSHFFDLAGPNMVVDSACSSSLVGVHLACQSLALNESEMALAGGAELLLDEDPYLLLSEGKALSPSGRCHTFDEAADGFVPGEGAGMVLLKRLDRAEREGDRILAVIEAATVNNDGHTMGYTTPSMRAQSELIRRTVDRGQIDPRTIGYVETHGTGTMIGDPIELQALATAFRRYTADRAFCGVGSVKTNIGHLLSAAGVAGLIKVVLCLHHQRVPPTLNCAAPNPRFAFSESPFYPVTELRNFGAGPGLERAALSSFGFGGTNAHMILRRGSILGGVRSRQSLPAPTFRKKRFWFDREEGSYAPNVSAPVRAAARAEERPLLQEFVSNPRSARLDPTFLPTG